jgi:hypothetical protein
VHHDPEPAVVIDDDFDVVVALAGPMRKTWSAEHPMPAAIGDPTELLVVLVNERTRMAGDITDGSSSDSVGIDETVEAAAGQNSMDS